MSKSTTSGGSRIVAFSAVVLVSMVSIILVVAGTGDHGLHLAIRSTAQTSVCLFLAAFCASSLYRFWPRPWSRWLLINRRYVGLSFAVSHALHLAAIATLAATSTEFRGSVETGTIIGGGLAYVFIALMAATSSDAAVRFLGQRAWKTLHTIGAYYIWFIFFQSYAGRAVQSPSYIPAALACVAAVALRVSTRLVARRSSETAGRSPQSA